MPAARTPRPWLPFALALAALPALAPALGGGFVHDDVPQIAGNPLVQSLRHLTTLWTSGVWAGAGAGSSWYRPLFTSSLALDVRLFGLSPAALHATQLLWQALAIAALVRLVQRIDGRDGVAAGAGLALALHPVAVESGAWISARPDVQAALFVALALLAGDAALRGAGSLSNEAGTSPRDAGASHGDAGTSPGDAEIRPDGAAAAGRRALAPALACGVAFFLALAAKESAVVALPALAALAWLRAPRRSSRAHVVALGTALVALAAYGVLRANALGSVGGGVGGALDVRFVLGAMGQGVRRLLVPAGLTIAPPPPAPLDLALGALVAAVGLFALAAAARARCRALVPLALGGAALAVAALAAARIGELADRYLLLVLASAAWLVAGGIAALSPRPRRLALAAAAALAVLALAASHRHAAVYRSNAALWADARAKHPASLRATLNLATARIEEGALDEADGLLDAAARLAKDDPDVALNRAVIAQERGDAAGARRLLEALAAQRGDADWRVQLRLGHLALERDDLAEAEARYTTALRGNALLAEALAGLGVVHARSGRGREARAAIERALALDPRVQNAAALRRILVELPR